MTDKLYDALEHCLQALEQGADLDSVLERYPDLAQDLRPLLQTSLMASMISAAPSAETMQRGRARLLQKAAEMREEKAQSRRAQRRWWGAPAFQRVAIALTLAAIFLLSGTGLVRASSSTLPGDHLYPVKRTWEGVRVLLTFSEEAREALEGEHEEERLHEILELLAKGREAQVTFDGVYTEQAGQVSVSGIPVLITAQTRLPEQPLQSGDGVRVIGWTNAQGFVQADEIQRLPLGSVVPMGISADTANGIEKNGQGAANDNESPRGNENESGSGAGSSSGNESPQNQNDNEEGGSSSQRTPFKVEGVLEVMNGEVWIVNRLTVYVSDARIEGTPVPGAIVEIKGYFQADGKFIATQVEVKSSDEGEKDKDKGGGNENRNENGNEQPNGNDNHNDNDNQNSNDNHNENDNENTNDHNENNDNEINSND